MRLVRSASTTARRAEEARRSERTAASARLRLFQVWRSGTHREGVSGGAERGADNASEGGGWGGTGDSRAGAPYSSGGTTAAAEEGLDGLRQGEGSAAEGAGLGDGGEEDVAEESLERNTVEEGGADEGWGEGDLHASCGIG